VACELVDVVVLVLDLGFSDLAHERVVSHCALKHLLGSELGQEGKRLLQVNVRTDEQLQLVRFIQVGAMAELLYEQVEQMLPLLNELLVFVVLKYYLVVVITIALLGGRGGT
jgi:hypothetical protein